MRVSVNLTNYSWPGDLTDHLLDVARAADEAGIDTLWGPDHLLQADPNAAPGETEMLEAYTVLGFLAARTERVRLGTMVTGVTFRPPALLVKAVTTVDVLSGGRSWLGIGAGYHAPEAEAMGLFLPQTAERFQRLEETLEIATRLWRGDRSRYDGRHYTLEAPVGDPPPASRPHPPILIGGMGEKHTLRLVARFGDAGNLFDIPDGGATIRHKLDVLRRHCDAIGRDYDTIDKTVSTRYTPGRSPAERLDALAALGIEHAVFVTAGPWTPEAIAALR